jgi:hypothetical protein
MSSNTTAIKLALTQMRAAMTALESALGAPAKAEVKETKVKEEKEKKVRKPTAWTAYVTEHGGVVKASKLKKADPAAYDEWAAEWKEANEGEVPAPVAAEPKARKPRSDKGKPRAKKPVETVEEAEETEEDI